MSTTDPKSSTEEPQGPVPPYEGKEDRPIQENPISKSSGSGGPPEVNRTASYDDEDDLSSDTDMNPDPAKGVGKSTRKSAEDIADDTAEGHQGPSQRPYGGTDPEDSSAIDPQENTTGGPNAASTG